MMKRVKPFVVSFWLGIILGLSSWPPVMADDTEIYTRQIPTVSDVRPADSRPNILFIFDRSGSMNWVDYAADGTPLYGGKKRIERLKEAFLSIMDEIEDVNVGFGSFTGNGKRGAAINFPISDVEIPVSKVEGEEDLPPQETNRISSSSNDAEEDSTGKVTLDSDNLEMTRYTEAEETVLELELTGYNDNMIREILNGSNIGRTYFGTNGNAPHLGANDKGEGLLALRFPNLDIPKEANIANATIQFTPLVDSSAGLIVDVEGVSATKPLPPNLKSDGSAINNAQKSAYPITLGANAWSSTSSAKITWEVPAWTKNQQDSDTTVDVTSIVQEAVNDTWIGDGADVLGFLFQSKLMGGTGRKFYATTAGKRPKLKITYTDPGDAAELQTVGLRFENVRVIQGAKIRSARIEFTSGASVDENATLMISGEKVTDSEPFTTEDSNLSSRAKTNAETEWKPEAWVENEIYSTVDISDIVQEIVDQGEWCGGNAMSFFVSSTDNPLRNARSFDHIEEDTSPVLKVDYSIQDLSNDACIKNTHTTSIASPIDDAEETDDQAMFVTSTLEMTTDAQATRTVGLRFRELPLYKNTTITNASLTFMSAADEAANADPANLDISMEKTPDAQPFGSIDSDTSAITSASPGDISGRSKTESVKWNITTPWVAGEKYETPEEVNVELAKLFQQIVDQSGWQPFNDVAVFIDGSGLREVVAATGNNKENSVRLKLEIQGALASGEVFTTVRERIKELADEMLVGGGTPLVDAIYEAGQYYTGGAVDIGTSRYIEGEKYNSIFKRNRVSHAGSWTDGSLTTPSGCTKATAWDEICIQEKIEGTPRYTPPPTPACAKDYIVFLTDGSANGTNAKDKVKALVGGSCMQKYSKPESGMVGENFVRTYEEKYTSDDLKVGKYVNDSKNKTKKDSDEECGTDMVKYLHEKHNVVIHTVGFSLGNYYSPTVKSGSTQWVLNEQRTDENNRAEAYMREWAATGGGNFYEATSASDLISAFRSIFSLARTESAAFAAPTVSVSAFNNRLFHNNEVYFALFKPADTPLWQGNIKKYKLCGDDGGCSNAGTLLDAKGNAAADAATQKIKSGATSYWSTADGDGPDVTQGGAGSQLKSAGLNARRIFTLTDTEVNTQQGANRNIDIITGVDNENPSGNYIHPDNEALTKSLLLGGFDSDGTPLTEATADTAMSDEDREILVNWIRGRDAEDEDNDGDKTDLRWMMGDPLHSSPGAITYGGTEENPDVRLFYGTNDGLIRMLDARDNSGQEKWAFLPPDLLPIQPALMKNQSIGRRIYGMDGSPTFWIQDMGTVGEISGNDFVKMYIGMRRGGRNYYSLDVSDPERPKLRWTIKGGQEGDDFEFLGQTWSDIKVARVLWQGEPRTVLFFGGGYDFSADNIEGGADGSLKAEDGRAVGNAVYMADAETGQLLWWASNNDGADLRLVDMKYAVPSNLTLYDNDTDRYIDRLYFGDMGGQMWRIDFDFNGTQVAHAGAVIASIGLDYHGDGNTEKRRFFYSPAVKRTQCFGQEYYAVTATTGTRPTPLDNIVRDRFFAFKDTVVTQKLYDMTTPYPTIKSFEKTMYDATDDVTYENSDKQREAEEELKKTQGWYIDLLEGGGWKGEKGMASPVILNDVIFFTTYSPLIEVANPAEGECSNSAGDGTSFLYAANICNGTAARDFDEDDENAALDENGNPIDDGSGGNNSQTAVDSRNTSLGSGVISDISALYTDDNTIRFMSNSVTLPEQQFFNRVPEFIFWRQN